MSEPAEDTPFGPLAAARATEDPLEGASIFNLSGGIMKPAAKTANRIDGLLSKMLLQPRTGQYVADIDKNLDYLFTSLQLDMITMVAESSAEENEEDTEVSTTPGLDSKLLLGSPLHDESREG